MALFGYMTRLLTPGPSCAIQISGLHATIISNASVNV
jgi:hypothetical protein